MPIDLTDQGLEASFSMERERGGAVEEPPFRILALGDWSGDAEKAPFATRKPIEIDRDNFDEVIERLGSKVDLAFQEGESLELEFRSLDDFHPDQIFRRVDLFAQLRDLRKRLKDPNSFNSTAREARRLFGLSRPEPSGGGSAAAAAEAPADNLLDAILTKPEGGAATPKPGVSGELGRLVGELVRPHLVSVDEDEQKALIAATDAATSGLMRKILHHPRFRALEAAVRGLHLLVRRTDTSSDLKIFALDATKEELSDDLRSAESLASTHLYRLAVRDAVEVQGGEPWAIICAAYAYEGNVDDVAALMRIGKIAEAAGAPFVAHMRPDVLGVHSFHESPEPKSWRAAADTDSGKLWSALRGQSEAKFLGMTTPRFLARLPYGADTEPLENFTFEEFEGTVPHDDYCWTNGSFLAAMLLAQSYSAHGWEMGRKLIQDVEGLPLHVVDEDGATGFKPCAEIVMTDHGVNFLMEQGFMPLISYKSSDHVKLGRFQSIADPSTGLKGRWSN